MRAKLDFGWDAIMALFLFTMLLVGCRSGSTPQHFGTSASPRVTMPPGAETWSSSWPTSPNTQPELIDALSSHNAEDRIGAARALGAMGRGAKAAVPAISRNLYYDGVYDVREAAAWALGRIGPVAKPAIPTLVTVLLTDSVHVRYEAAVALGQIGDHSALPALARSLHDENLNVRIASAEAIAQLADLMFAGVTPSSVGSHGYELDSTGEAIIVLEARKWWESTGQVQDWVGREN